MNPYWPGNWQGVTGGTGAGAVPEPPPFPPGKYTIKGGRSLIIVSDMGAGNRLCRWFGDNNTWTGTEVWLKASEAKPKAGK